MTEIFNPIFNKIKSNQQTPSKTDTKNNQNKIMTDWYQYINNNKDKKVDIPVALSFTMSGKIKISYNYSNTIREFLSIDEAMSFIRNFITV